MPRTGLIASIASVAVIAGTPAIAKPGGGAGAGVSVGRGAAAGKMDVRSTVRDITRSQRGANANARAVERANATGGLSTDLGSESPTGTRIHTNSRIDTTAQTRVSAMGGTSLTGVTTGMSVVDTGGTTIGTVTGIRTTGNGSAKTVQVTLTDGTTINLRANSLSLDGDVLTTDSLTTNVNSQGAAHASINGLIHASPNSALATAGVTTLTGLTTGLAVNTSGGTNIGTVSSVLLNRSGAVVGVNVELSGGGTVMIPATTLSMDGTTVVTSFDVGG